MNAWRGNGWLTADLGSTCLAVSGFRDSSRSYVGRFWIPGTGNVRSHSSQMVKVTALHPQAESHPWWATRPRIKGLQCWALQCSALSVTAPTPPLTRWVPRKGGSGDRTAKGWAEEEGRGEGLWGVGTKWGSQQPAEMLWSRPLSTEPVRP